jgi:hypothetical protein
MTNDFQPRTDSLKKARKDNIEPKKISLNYCQNVQPDTLSSLLLTQHSPLAFPQPSAPA